MAPTPLIYRTISIEQTCLAVRRKANGVSNPALGPVRPGMRN